MFQLQFQDNFKDYFTSTKLCSTQLGTTQPQLVLFSIQVPFFFMILYELCYPGYHRPAIFLFFSNFSFFSVSFLSFSLTFFLHSAVFLFCFSLSLTLFFSFSSFSSYRMLFIIAKVSPSPNSSLAGAEIALISSNTLLQLNFFT